MGDLGLTGSEIVGAEAGSTGRASSAGTGAGAKVGDDLRCRRRVKGDLTLLFNSVELVGLSPSLGDVVSGEEGSKELSDWVSLSGVSITNREAYPFLFAESFRWNCPGFFKA